MAKEPSCRYATAQELATDLSRFLDDQPILARRPGVPERALRWTRRHKELVAWAAARSRGGADCQHRRDLGGSAQEPSSKPMRQCVQTNDASISSSRVIPSSTGKERRAIQEANGQLWGQTDPATRKEAAEIIQQWLDFFKQTIELPPNDLKSREVIARAYSRLGYAHWMLSMAKPSNGRPDPQLLAAALAEYRQSVALLEKLLADSPGDPKIRRYLAESIGLGSMGCCLRIADRTEEAESLYARTIQIRRELLLGLGTDGVADVRAPADVAGQLEDLPYLASTVHLMAQMLEGKGRAAEAQAMRRQLEDDVVAVAAQLSEPRFQRRRQVWAGQLTLGQIPYFDASNRRDTMINHRLAFILDPRNATVLNNLAWSLVSRPNDPWFDPAEGLTLARKAVELEPNQWSSLNTLGVAAFRTRDWNTAAKVLQQSVTFTGGGADDLFFLAMTYWHQGNHKDARDMYDRAVAWTAKNKPNDPELQQFRAEAAALIGLPSSKPKPGTS